MTSFEPERLDDAALLGEGDPSGMLPAVASSAAQVRTAHRAALEAGVSRLSRGDRPRAIVVAGMGTSALAGDVLAAVCGGGVPIPIVTVRSYRLPGWVGAADLVIAVSSSGATEETQALALEAVRRGCRLLAVCRPGSPLAAIAEQASGLHLPVATVAGGHPAPRASLWALAVPMLAVAAELGLTDVGPQIVEAVAARLEDLAHRCRPSSESFINPGKTLAMELAGTIPMVWGTSPVTAVAASRLASQLAKNAKYPAISGEMPAAGHDQVSVFDGPLAERDIFADGPSTTLRLVVLRDLDEHPQVSKKRVTAVRLAEARGVPVTEVSAEGEHPLERLASLVGLIDYGTVYLALGYGVDPAPVAAVTELKARATP
ncbi:phosphomannose isomerase [Sphaerisporangium melleum]|uniref:Phosphomannose isomerase n=1 Tax=Sphaerisporangium melleum TaxID=321316 RepID=A0A917QRZ5_9ACTN|nr:SIS domain-containing protein [Sphaerisporangium melleum]GGK65014.1 phosphomannose isomerase [Sphaerisporangium melleum]GII70012.1 phosphomannose isomerase [Sphaerisporangium melleum]